MIVELLAVRRAGRASTSRTPSSRTGSAKLGIGTPRFAPREQPAADLSHPAMAVNLDACIQCTRCVRACREEQVNDVIGYAFRGAHSSDRVRPRRSDGRVDVRRLRRMRAGLPDRRARAGERRVSRADRQARSPSVCPYCGVGCQLTYHVKDNEIVRVEGRDGPANHERLCVKGRFGFDYVAHPQRLTKPLIRSAGVPKSADFTMDPADPLAGVPRGDVGRGAGARRRHARAHPRHARAARARGLRLGQGQQRGGVPVPEARAHRLRHEQRRPLHAPVPRVERRGAARRHRLGRGVEPGDGRDEGRGRAADRRQSRRQSSGRRDVDQERGQERHEADPRRPAPLGARAPRDALPAVQARHRRRAAERDDAHDRRGRPRRRGRSSPTARAATRSCAKNVAGVQPRGDGAGLRHSGARRSARSRGCSRRRRAR